MWGLLADRARALNALYPKDAVMDRVRALLDDE